MSAPSCCSAARRSPTIRRTRGSILWTVGRSSTTAAFLDGRGEFGARFGEPLICHSPRSGFGAFAPATLIIGRESRETHCTEIRGSPAAATANRGSLPAPLHEALKGVKLGQPEAVIRLGCLAVAVLGPLPEFSAVAAAGEHRPVLLRLVAENRLPLPVQVVRAEGDDPLQLVRLKLLP